MDETAAEGQILYPISCRGIVIEFLQDHRCSLATKGCPLPESNLLYEYVTLTPKHRPNTSAIFRWFRSAVGHCNSHNGANLLAEMIAVFRMHQQELSEYLRDYVLSKGIGEVCYRGRVGDSQLVKQVLDLLYENWSSFLSYQLLYFECSYFQATGERLNEQSGYLNFYFEHARLLRSRCNGVRFIDLSGYSSGKGPVFKAAEFWHWKPLLRYLQFGAKFEDVMVDASYTWYGVQSAMTDTLRRLVRDLWFELVQPANDLSLTDPEAIQEYCSKPNRKVRHLCRTLKIILRSVKHIQHDVLEFVVGTTVTHPNAQPVEEVASAVIINHPTVQLMLPTLIQRYGCPMQLQHACRCAIRERLNENWQLPAGIQHLHTPKRIKKYLNLLSD